MDREAGRGAPVMIDNRALPRVDVLGVGVNAIDMDGAIEEIARWISDDEQHYVCVTGVHGVMESQADPTLLAIHNGSGLTTPDGMPLVWAGRYAGARAMRQVCGPELFPAVCARAEREGWRMFLYGGNDGVPELLAERLRAAHPEIQVVGTLSPPFRPLTSEEDAEIIERINTAAPDIVWVGLSTPKQERWMAAHVGRVHAPVMVGVGAAFDIHAGLRQRPPRWVQRAGLEWAFRLLVEPRRLARRYLKNNPRFVVRILRQPPRIVTPNETP
jgi:N-acetylglucosaminyldiphosphoundecaprenol N-acetyl-beta-D-mannosaminyltransferase